MTAVNITNDHIHHIERCYLNEMNSSSIKISQESELTQLYILKIKGFQSFWNEFEYDKILNLRIFVEDILAGLQQEKVNLFFSIIGSFEKEEIYIGTFEENEEDGKEKLEIIKTVLKSSFYGIDFLEVDGQKILGELKNFQSSSLMVGTPTSKTGKDKGLEQIERVMRGLYGREWAYVVTSVSSKLNAESICQKILNELRIVQNFEKRAGIESPVSKQYKKLLDVSLTKYQNGKNSGVWDSSIQIFAKTDSVLSQVEAISKSAFGGKSSVPDCVQCIRLPKNIRGVIRSKEQPPKAPGELDHSYRFMSTLTSPDLACYIHFPVKEMPGFNISPYARFSVSLKTTKSNREISLGKVLDNASSTNASYSFGIEDLNKHGLVVGTTGSGKTNTLFYLIKEVNKHNIPFLVLEPAKTEYRKLIREEAFKSKIQVFTLGENNVSPFRINPFEVLPGINLQSHIDLLKSVFNGSFLMWGPLPHILEECLHSIYEDKGWSLEDQKNERGDGPEAMPTLSDLYNKVDIVVERIGYSEESTMELKSALKTRIKSLMLGGKGMMLDTQRSIDFERLLKKHTILELEPIADDEEKAFLMGLILSRMYQYYISKGVFEGKGLSHITIIEEAHRLLSNQNVQNPNVANTKGKAVETFTNLLSEIRAYGEGFLIVDQIPTKLSSDVIKNTNLKIMHRLLSDEDRKAMSGTMGIAEKELRSVMSFKIGEAAVFSGGDDGAFRVGVPYAKVRDGAVDKDEENQYIKEEMNKYLGNTFLAPLEACNKHCSSICLYKKQGEKKLTDERYHSQIKNILFLLILGSDQLLIALNNFIEFAVQRKAQVENKKNLIKCTIIQGLDFILEEFGSEYSIEYDNLNKLKENLLGLFWEELEKYLKEESSINHDDNLKTEIANTLHGIVRYKQKNIICETICEDNKCLYRYFLKDNFQETMSKTKFEKIINSDTEDLIEALYSFSSAAIDEMLLIELEKVEKNKMILCQLMHLSLRTKEFSWLNIKALMNALIDYTD